MSEQYTPERIAAMVEEAKRPLRDKIDALETTLAFIALYGGKTTDEMSCNGTWCAEQARRVLDTHA